MRLPTDQRRLWLGDLNGIDKRATSTQYPHLHERDAPSHARMKFRDFVRILERHGFELHRQRGSHRIYKAPAGGRTRIVVVACHNEGDEIKPGTLSSMIRQSGLPRHLFRT